MTLLTILSNTKTYVHEALEIFNVKGGVILGVFSVEMLALIPYYAVTHQQFPATVRDIYLGVVTAFACTNVAKHYAATKNGGTPE